ncbi:MAG: hypothetical protein NTW05_19600 [Pseudonocardiales bacterium]|nr:hypothetical protein [Pseudonocardiales bacterium]
MEYAIQARLIERRGNIVVRDETRRDVATELSVAVRTARAHAADGFTVWIYEVHRDDGVRPTYVTVDTFSPDAAPPSGADARVRRRTCPPEGRL